MATCVTMNQILTELKVAMTKNESRNCKYHIVFIGASGSGKTSLLNLIGNFSTMNEGGWDRITTDFKLYNDTKLERALDDPMASKTSSSRSYDMKIGDVTFMITDTPGLGVDSYGIGKEKENVANIVQHLKTVDYVHCICLVINGRTPRGIPEVKYALSEISALLPNVATSNMIMCLTNCEKICQASLKPKILNEFFKSEIDPSKTFCIDNPLCIMENAMRLNKIDDELEDIKRGFDLANKEFTKLVHSIKEFNPIPTTSFLEVYAAKQAVEREVLAITMHQYNHEELQKKKTASNAGKVTFSKIIMTEDQHYNTLCDHPGCYSNCHLQCKLPHSYDPEVFKNCACMVESSQPGVCAICKHNYVTHYHQYVKFQHQDVCVEYETIVAQIKKEIAQALEILSARIQHFHKLSSTKDYIQVLQTQLEVIKVYKTTYGKTESLETAQARLQSAMKAIHQIKPVN